MSRVLVTGGTGFIGRALCPILLRHGVRVSVATRSPRVAETIGGVDFRPIPGVWPRVDWSVVLRDVDAIVATHARDRKVAAWLQGAGLQKGDRVAVMMPNVLQNPVAVYGILRAGLVVVNVNPLYTPRELEHQLNDSGAKAIFGPGTVIAQAAADLLGKLNAQLGYKREAAE